LLSTLYAARDTQKFFNRFSKSVLSAAVFSFAFCLVLVPWTIRNRRVFGVFQPLSPAHGEMPGEFGPRGYLMWLRTWLDDGRYIGPVLWRLDTSRIPIEAYPKRAFDSSAERDRVAALMDKYNHPVDEEDTTATPTPSPSPATPDQTKQSDEATDEDEEEEEAEEDPGADDPSNVEMTPEIDAAFAQLARERIARAPFQYYVMLPLKRARSLWFDTHSQYYPFEGELFPLDYMDYSIHQQYWLPLFAGLTWAYTLLGALGAWCLLRARSKEARLWLALAGLIIFLRLGFFSTLENPEPRYVVEIFPFLAILGGIAIGFLTPLRKDKSEQLNAVLD